MLNSDVHSDNGSSPDVSPRKIFVRVQNKQQKESSFLFKNQLLSVEIQQVPKPENIEYPVQHNQAQITSQRNHSI